MKTPKPRQKGRPPIPGKKKYTLTLMEGSVDAFRQTRSNLSGFVDECLDRYLKTAK